MAARNVPSKGGKPDKLMRDALVLALKREAVDADGRPTKKLNLIADALVDKAMTGDVAACKEIADRVDGKSVQPISGDDDGAPIKLELIKRVIVKPHD